MSLSDYIGRFIKKYHSYAVYGKGFLLVMALRIIYMMRSAILGPSSNFMPFSRFIRDLDLNRVVSVKTEAKDILNIGLVGGDKVGYFTEIPSIVDKSELWGSLSTKKGLHIGTSSRSRMANTIVSTVYALSPVVYLGMLYYFMQRMMNPGASDSERRAAPQLKNPVGLKDVAGISTHARRALNDLLDGLASPEAYQKVGARRPRGVLLYGPAGCGKTLIARAVAGEANLPFFVASASDFVELLVGRGAARVRKLFAQAEECAPSIIFIDEIDALAKARGGLLSGNDEREQTLNQLLTELDGFEVKPQNVLVMAATNRPDVLDAALLRAGRFDLHIKISPPTLEGREELLRVHVARVVTPSMSDTERERLIKALAQKTPGACVHTTLPPFTTPRSPQRKSYPPLTFPPPSSLSFIHGHI